MRTTRRTRSSKVAVVVGLGIASMIGSAPPAFATAVTITSMGCESRPVGALCEGYVSGGTGSYTFTWSRATRTRSDYANGSLVTISCTGFMNVTFTVTDSSGATASQTGGTVCGQNN